MAKKRYTREQFATATKRCDYCGVKKTIGKFKMYQESPNSYRITNICRDCYNKKQKVYKTGIKVESKRLEKQDMENVKAAFSSTIQYECPGCGTMYAAPGECHRCFGSCTLIRTVIQKLRA